MQSPFFKPIVPDHIAAVMDAPAFAILPGLVAGASDLGVGTLTICTVPPDLRLCDPVEAASMVDALFAALVERGGDVCLRRLSLVGRRYFLPSRLTCLIDSTAPRRGNLHLRIAVDYACKASLLSQGGETPASLLLLPFGVEPGNLLRWQFARAAWVPVDWPGFDAAGLSALLDDLPGPTDRSHTRPPAFA